MPPCGGGDRGGARSASCLRWNVPDSWHIRREQVSCSACWSACSSSAGFFYGSRQKHAYSSLEEST